MTIWGNQFKMNRIFFFKLIIVPNRDFSIDLLLCCTLASLCHWLCYSVYKAVVYIRLNGEEILVYQYIVPCPCPCPCPRRVVPCPGVVSCRVRVLCRGVFTSVIIWCFELIIMAVSN